MRSNHNGSPARVSSAQTSPEHKPDARTIRSILLIGLRDMLSQAAIAPYLATGFPLLLIMSPASRHRTSLNPLSVFMCWS